MKNTMLCINEVDIDEILSSQFHHEDTIRVIIDRKYYEGENRDDVITSISDHLIGFEYPEYGNIMNDINDGTHELADVVKYGDNTIHIIVLSEECNKYELIKIACDNIGYGMHIIFTHKNKNEYIPYRIPEVVND